MPGRDGSGPLGRGALTGRGLGVCSGVNAIKYGAGLGAGLGLGYAYRRGLGRGLGLNYIVDQPQSKTQKELLMEQKEILANRLDVIDKELEKL